MPATLETADTQVAITTTGGGTDTVTVTKPTNLVDGDWVVILSGDGGCGACPENVALTAPSGFTQDLQVLESLYDDFRLAIFSKYIDNAAGEPANYTVNLGQDQNGGSAAIALRISGASIISWYTQLGTHASGASTTVAANSITTTETGKGIVRFAGASNQNGGTATTEWGSHDADFIEVQEAGGTDGAVARRFSGNILYDAANASTTVDDTGSTVQARSFVPGQTSWIAVLAELRDFVEGEGVEEEACCPPCSCVGCSDWHIYALF